MTQFLVYGAQAVVPCFHSSVLSTISNWMWFLLPLGHLNSTASPYLQSNVALMGQRSPLTMTKIPSQLPFRYITIDFITVFCFVFFIDILFILDSQLKRRLAKMLAVSIPTKWLENCNSNQNARLSICWVRTVNSISKGVLNWLKLIFKFISVANCCDNGTGSISFCIILRHFDDLSSAVA